VLHRSIEVAVGSRHNHIEYISKNKYTDLQSVSMSANDPEQILSDIAKPDEIERHYSTIL
jgi:hypothetical protein